MKIFIASDHAGFELKGKLVSYVKELGYNVTDMGPDAYDKEDDYPDLIIPCAQKVASDLKNNLGIVLGGSGQGEAIAANKVKGIRAAVFHGKSMDIVSLSKTHNGANILSMGARFVSESEAKKAVKLWLETNFTGEERHQRRIDKLIKFEGKH